MPTQLINLNDTTPAAPSGKVNIKWQAGPVPTDPTQPRQVSAYVDPPGGGGGGTGTWHTGAGAPSSGLGTDGDMYLNTSNGDVYGPKASGAWGSPVCNITGPAGANGTSSTWHTGSGVPSPSLGGNTDLYLNTANGDVYQKITGTWTLEANIIGPTGATGIGVPAGGTTGQVLGKNSNTDYDTYWTTPTTGGSIPAGTPLVATAGLNTSSAVGNFTFYSAIPGGAMAVIPSSIKVTIGIGGTGALQINAAIWKVSAGGVNSAPILDTTPLKIGGAAGPWLVNPGLLTFDTITTITLDRNYDYWVVYYVYSAVAGVNPNTTILYVPRPSWEPMYNYYASGEHIIGAVNTGSPTSSANAYIDRIVAG